jgi:hypothetical protein
MKQTKEHKLTFGRRLVRHVRTVFAEHADAERRMAEIRFAPDHYAFRPATPPDTYAEFLFRTSGPRPHEAPARKRIASR